MQHFEDFTSGGAHNLICCGGANIEVTPLVTDGTDHAPLCKLTETRLKEPFIRTTLDRAQEAS